MYETKWKMLLLVLCAAAAHGCSAAAEREPPHRSGPLGAAFSANTVASQPTKANLMSPGAEPAAAITLPEALSRALRDGPGLAAFSWEIRAREAAALQAAVRPNPELRIELENFAGSGDTSGFDQAEATIRLAQLIELGGKRSKRKSAAERERELAGWDYEAARIDTFTRVVVAFVRVLAAQERLRLSEELVAADRRSLRVVAEQVEAGAVSAVERSRAEVSLASSDADLARRRRDLDTAKARLATEWGSATVSFTRAVGGLEEGVLAPPSRAALLEEIDENPDVARWETELAARRATIALEESKGLPDVTLAAGSRWFEDTDDGAFVMDMSIPLPLFDRNQGASQEAQHRFAKSLAERTAARIEVEAALIAAYGSLAAAYETVTTLQQRVLPKATDAYAGATSAYRRGVLRYLDVLDAQRTLYSLRTEYIDSLAAYHTAAARVERLVGRSLEDIRNAEDRN